MLEHTTSPTLAGHYDYPLVVLSVFIAILASYAALDLAGRVTSARDRIRSAWLFGGAIAMGTGVWSMHYIGMLAFELPIQVYYHWPTVLVSLLAAVLASGIALFVVSRKTMAMPSAITGAVIMGGGIAAMHYIGMAAMRMPAMHAYSMPLVILSVVVAIAISLIALHLTFAMRNFKGSWGTRKFLSALIMGCAIPIMHYIGMAAVTFISVPLSTKHLKHVIGISEVGIAGITIVTLMVLGMVFITSITDRKISAQAMELEANEQRYRQIVETAFDAFVGFDTDLIVTNWNAQAEKTFGCAREKAIGRSIDDFLRLDFKDGNHTLQKCLQWEDGDTMQRRMEVIGIGKDETEFFGEMTASAIGEEEKRMFAAFVQNVTERKQIEQEREEARIAAEAGSRAKSEFLANMSHEIRTPLNGIVGMTDLTLETELTAEQREYLQIVKQSADSLLNVINDVLDFSKIEAGKIDLENIEFDLRDSVEATLRTFALAADEKDLELLCDLDPKVPHIYMGDPNRLRQILVNLVGNAIKFTHKGEITLNVCLEGSTDEFVFLHFVVKDTGIGISEDKRGSIFESFIQADTSTTREYGGTGLGLTISKRLIEMMGGRLWIESEIGKGSEFHFTIKLRLGLEKPLLSGSSSEGRELVGARVLIVDDNRTNRRILDGLLTTWGMKTTVASDAEQALIDLGKTQTSGEFYDLILTDLHMPKMDGFGLVESIHANGARAATIMMLSSGGQRGDAARCETLGIAAYLLKPVRQVELKAAIVRVLRSNEAPEVPAMITSDSLRRSRVPNASLDILVAEDNEINRKLAVRLLEKRGHRTSVVNNGREALKELQRRRYDLVLMDVQMPEMSGTEATTELRNWEKSSGTYQPIVAMTAMAMKGDKEKCLEAGMNGYLSKPIRPLELDNVLEQYAEKDNTAEPETSDKFLSPLRKAVDTQELWDRLGNDHEFLAELVDIFRQDCPRQVQDLHLAVSSKDTYGLTHTAHTLKGALANLSAPDASTLAADLEEMSKTQDLTRVDAALKILEAELDKVLYELEILAKGGSR